MLGQHWEMLPMKIDRFFMSFLLTQRILSFGSGGKTECEWIQLLSSMSVERSQSSNNERRSLREGRCQGNHRTV